MKKILRIISVLLIAGMILASSSVFAEGEDRVLDPGELFTSSDIESLELSLTELESGFGVKGLLAISTEADRDGLSLADYLEEEAEERELSQYDAFAFGFDPETEETLLLLFGEAETKAGTYREYITDTAAQYREEYSDWGVLYVPIALMKSVYSRDTGENAGDTALPDQEGSVPSSESAENAEPLPELKAEDGIRVYDRAGILDPDDITAIEKRIAELAASVKKDIVIYTDTKTYGMDISVAAADLYDFGGFGIGEDNEGLILYVSMDPLDRQWWVCATGDDTMGLYTEYNANILDDILYEDFVSGAYGKGILSWLDGVENLYKKGAPFTPSWYPDLPLPERKNDPSSPRIFDETGTLSADEIAEYTKTAKEISDKYGLDVVVDIVNIDPKFGMGEVEYAETLYRTGGYGFGENYDGLLFTVYPSRGECWIYTSGNGAEGLKEKGHERIIEHSTKKLEEQDVSGAVAEFLSNYGYLRKTGRVKRSLGSWFGSLLLSLGIGGATGGISLAGAKRKMAVPAIATNASAYIVGDSVNIGRVSDDLINISTVRQYSPPYRSSDSGGRPSSGIHHSSSSFSHSYSGHSGTSHSGSGRKF